jgi:hypothetical protein
MRELLTRLFRWNAGTSCAWQAAGLVLVWAYVVGLHLSNDGMWYQGDSSRHAMNGVFWWDFLKQFPTSPFGFALAYYARYPVINPVAYPPFFYLVEGGAYQVFGVSPMVSKALVLASLLLASAYVLAWLRRWVAAEAGWVALLFPLQPGLITWSHAVMLNVPAMALALAALYHARRWLEAPSPRHVYATVAFGTVAVLTYLPIAVLVPIVFLWALAQRRLRRLFTLRSVLTAAVPAGIVLAWVWLAVPWSPNASVARSLTGHRWALQTWVYYPAHLTEIVSLPLLGLAAAGAIAAVRSAAGRRELGVYALWLGACYVWFTLVTAGFTEARYVLLVVPAVLALGALGVAAVVRALASPAWLPAATVTAALVLTGTHAASAAQHHVRDVRGFQDVAAYVRSVAPNERIFYDGQYDGVFAIYLRATDPKLAQAITRGANIVYSTRLSPQWGLVEHATAPDDITELLRQRCGCRVFVVEKQLAADMAGVRSAANLRTALEQGPFEVLRSFRVSTPDVTDVVVYRLTAPASDRASVELRFPFIAGGKAFDVAPLEVKAR